MKKRRSKAMKKSKRVSRKAVARHVKEADERRHEEVKRPSAAARAMGAHLSPANAKPGDIAYIGPCENGTRIVCYYDANMLPSDCRSQPC